MTEPAAAPPPPELAEDDPNFTGVLLEPHLGVRNRGLCKGFTVADGLVSSVWAAAGKRYPNRDLGTAFWYCSDGKSTTEAAMRDNIRLGRPVGLFVSEGNRMYDRGQYAVLGTERYDDGQRTHMRFEMRRLRGAAQPPQLETEVARQREQQRPVGRRTVFEAHAYDSRLEATRAVAFRRLGFDFVAHPEPSVPLGLPQRDRYTPDFRLRSVGLDGGVLEDVLWEVKPHVPPTEDRQICQAAADRTGFPLVLDCGRLPDWRRPPEAGAAMLLFRPGERDGPTAVGWAAGEAGGRPTLTSAWAVPAPLEALLHAREFDFDAAA